MTVSNLWVRRRRFHVVRDPTDPSWWRVYDARDARYVSRWCWRREARTLARRFNRIDRQWPNRDADSYLGATVG